MFLKIVTVLFTALLHVGCGYHHTGESELFPTDINSVSIPIFANKTHEAGIETIFTNSLINEFFTKKMVKIVSGKGADATVEGTIKSFSLTSLSYQRNDIVQEYRATVVLEILLKRNDSGKVIWEENNFLESEEYRVDTNAATSEANKMAAIVKIAEKISEKIHNRIFEFF